MPYVLSIDLGTSSLRAALYDERGAAVPGVSYQQEHRPETDHSGASELDAESLLESALFCATEALKKAGPRAAEIVGVGLSTFWHSVLGVGANGRAATPVLLWSDTRSAQDVETLKQRLDPVALHRRTGCVPHTSYLPARLLWVERERPEWITASRQWMSPGEYLLLRLCGEGACGVSMASGTGFYSHVLRDWDRETLAALPISVEQLNPIIPSLKAVGALREEFAARLPALRGLPWFPAAGDGACSNLGSGCVNPDKIGLMVGTSGAIRVMATATPDHPEPTPPPGLWKYRLTHERFLLGGALSNGGSLFDWITDTYQLPRGAELEAALAACEPDGHGLTVLPFLAGERCPGWRGDATAAIVGMRTATRPVEILRAGLESVALRFALIHERLRSTAAPGHQIVASGGALLASPTWTQILADALGEPVVACEETEASARGGALLALVGAGILPDLNAVTARLGRVYTPDPARHEVYVRARHRQGRLYDALIANDWAAGGDGGS